MASLDELAQAWLVAQSEAAKLGTREAVERAEEARLALAAHPAAQHARRTHGRGVVGVREGVED